jgi:hypothetical protein
VVAGVASAIVKRRGGARGEGRGGEGVEEEEEGIGLAGTVHGTWYSKPENQQFSVVTNLRTLVPLAILSHYLLPSSSNSVYVCLSITNGFASMYTPSFFRVLLKFIEIIIAFFVISRHTLFIIEYNGFFSKWD